MSQPHTSQVDEKLRAALLGAMQRDPEVLRNADHLYALLADLAPDMPPGLRNACVAVTRTNATGWLTHTPPYSDAQIVAWLRTQYPDLSTDHAHQAVAAVAELNGTRRVATPPPAAVPAPPPTPSAPVFDQATVAGTVASAAAPHPSFPPADMATQAPWQPNDYRTNCGFDQPPPPPSRGRRTAIILAAVAVLLIGGGVAAFFVFKSNGNSTLAAPQHVTAKLDGFGAVAVSWQPVDGADHYTIKDRSGALPATNVKLTSYVFSGAAGEDHQFVVLAVDENGDVSAVSDPVRWVKRISNVPENLTAQSSGVDITLTWDPVAGASEYQLSDESDPSFLPDPISGTSYTVPNAVYTAHSFNLKSVVNGDVSPPATTTWTPDNELSTSEAALAYKLSSKTVILGSCSSDTANETDTKYVVAAVVCDPTPGDRSDGPQALYAIQLNPGSQKFYEQEHFRSTETRGGCEDSFPPNGQYRSTWHFADGVTIGDEFCYIGGDGTNVYAWTYYDEDVVIQIEGKSPTTRSGLYAWWTNHATLLQ